MSAGPAHVNSLVTAMLVAVAAACGDGPVAAGLTESLTGAWDGSYTHPSTPGTLEVNFIVDGDSVTGSFALRFTSNGFVQNQGGSVTGMVTSPVTVLFDIVHPNYTWEFSGTTTGTGQLAGTWQSASSPGLDGTFTLIAR